MKIIQIILFVIISTFCHSQSFVEKIDVKLLSKTGPSKIVILLNDQVDISSVKNIRGKDKKAKFVYDLLLKNAEKSQTPLVKELQKLNLEYRSFYIVNMVSTTASVDVMKKLAQLPYVKSIIEDGNFVLEAPIENRTEAGQRSTEWGLTKINAPSVWSLGYTGQGVVIGGQDTGYEWEHNAIKSKYRGWDGAMADHDYNWHDAIHTVTVNPCGANSPFPCDDNNHGTHTMGTMVGDTTNFNIGVAPGAKWIGCRNMNNGDGTLTTYVECFEWFLAPYPVGQTPAEGDPTKSPHVINNSWSCPTVEGCNSSNFDLMELALNNLRSSGVVIVVSNGNSGSGCSTTDSPPAFFKNSFSVGATNDSDGIANFSSRGPVLADGSNRMKPDVAAPGVNVKSSITMGRYASYQGTSMAGPHVAGAVALLISAKPNLAGEVDQIENILRQTTQRLAATQNCGPIPATDIPNNTFGWGRIDALAAVNRALDSLFVPIIKIDQFGYLTNSSKTAILTNPITGYNDNDTYSAPSTIYVKDATTNAIVYSGSPVVWNSGATDPLSGDKVWWFDFSSVTTPGTYYISDNNLASETFEINDTIYNGVMETAFKTFYHQRCGHSKAIPYTTSAYSDATCHTQDANCRFINDPNNTGLYKDLSGGWHDAGDYNKYVNFAYNAVMDLLFAYEYNPEAWGDNLNIPESDNGIPDLLDELKYELDWILKMQDTDGGVFCVVGVQNYSTASPPSVDNHTRYYGPKTTSATYSAAAMLASAAFQFQKINTSIAQAYAATLLTKAELAYAWAVANPGIVYNNSGIIAAGEQELGSGYNTDMRQLAAAVYLYKTTNNATYKSYVETNYTNAHLLQWGYAYPFESILQQVLMHYAYTKGASSSVAATISNTYKNQIENGSENLPIVNSSADAYRSYIKSDDINWGSNSTKASKGLMYQIYNHYNLNLGNEDIVKQAYQDFIHYFHGSNPLGICYLSNMAGQGAERSINTIYHGWFENGSMWDDVRSSLYGPAPGFLPGGPNPNWNLDDCCTTTCSSNPDCISLEPPLNQPDLKSYKEWNTGWPQNSWAITENAIYYQAAYLNLLSSSVKNVKDLGMYSTNVVFTEKDLLIENSNHGIVLKAQNGNLFRLRVDIDGAISSTAIPNISGGSSKISNANIYMNNPAKGVILKDINSTYWKLYIDNSGQIQTKTESPIATELSQQNAGDISIDDLNYGIILKDSRENCYKLEVDNVGKTFTIPVTCN